MQAVPLCQALLSTVAQVRFSLVRSLAVLNATEAGVKAYRTLTSRSSAPQLVSPVSVASAQPSPHGSLVEASIGCHDWHVAQLSFATSWVRHAHSHAELPSWLLPHQHNKSRTERLARGEKAALQRIRACCTLQELRDVVSSQGSAPALVVAAAVQAPRVVQWPLGSADRGLLFELLGALTAQCAMHLEHYDLPQLAALVGACGRAHFTPDTLLLPLQLRIAADARRGGIKDVEVVASLAASLSRLRVRAPRIWAALGEAAQGVLEAANTAQLAALLAAHARADPAPNPRLFERAVARATAELRGAHPQDVATLMWALARRNQPCPRSLRRALTSQLASRGGEFGLLHVASLAGSAAKLGLRDAELHRLLEERGAQALEEEASALESVPRQPFARSSGSAVAGGAGAGQPPSSHAVAVLVSGLEQLEPGVHPTGVLRAATAFLLAAAATARRGGAAAAVHVELEHVEAVAAAALRAGLEEEHGELVQAYGLKAQRPRGE